MFISLPIPLTLLYYQFAQAYTMENKEGISFQVSNLRQAGVTFSIITASASEPLFEIGFCQKKKNSALSSRHPLLILDDDDECRSARSSQRLTRFTLNHLHRGNQSLLQHCHIRLDYATQYLTTIMMMMWITSRNCWG